MALVDADTDIAIIGMSCRVAGANSPSDLWDVLATSKDVQQSITRFDTKGFYRPDGASRKGLTNVKDAYMLDDDVIDKFDNAFFYTTPQEAVAIDPQQRMLLEIAYEAIENAGIPLKDFVGTDTAVYAGMEGCDYHTILARDLDATPRYLATGTPTCMAANRLSYFFNLSGPSMAVDTACSSTMAALHQAVRALQHGDSKMALVCSAKLILNPDMFMPSSELGFLSPSGRCQSFDAAGDGYGRGEGVLAILLKPLREAIADGDAVRSVIKGTRLNQDGRTQGITLPSADAQKKNMESLYHELGMDPRDIQYLEAHGTGTAAGDPIEFSAITSVFKPAATSREPLVVGSVKSNIGHLEACSALASVVKVSQCLERGAIPAQMHFRNPNPKIDFINVVVPTAMRPWPKTQDSVRRAAINTFGAGGTNGHAVLESYPLDTIEPVERSNMPLLFKVSAADEQSLKALCVNYANYIEKTRPDIYELAHTLLSRRSTLRKSVLFTARNLDEVITKLRAPSYNIQTRGSEGSKKVLFVFTGQGAQWAQMGKSLLDGSSLFREVILECDRVLESLLDPPSWSIMEELCKDKHATNVYAAEYSQPLCTALQLGILAMFKSWGLQPDAIVGHSSGEIAAAYAAGLISFPDAITNAYYRGLISSKGAGGSDRKSPNGAMCAIGVGEDSVRELLQGFSDRIQLAAVNSPTGCTVSGDRDAIEELIDVCKERGTFYRQLRVDVAYHSHHMSPLATQYQEALEHSGSSPQEDGMRCKMYSSVTGLKLMKGDCTPMYWSRNMTSTVRFYPAIEKMLEDFSDLTTAIEIGPHPALKGPTIECLRTFCKHNVEYFYTCSRDEGATELPLAAYLLMALEAARQILISDQMNGPLQLSDIQFQDGLSLDLLAGPDASLEIQLIAKLLEDHSEVYSFEIFSHHGSSEGVRDWRLHCSGKFDQQYHTLGATPIDLEQLGTAALHDAENANDEHRNHIFSKIETSPRGLTGDYQQARDPSEDFLIDPLVLDAIISLPPDTNAGITLPATYRVRSISSLTVTTLDNSAKSGCFAINIDSRTPHSVQATIKITQEKSNIVINGILQEAAQLRVQEPGMESLYFKPRSLPGITCLEAPEVSINFRRCVELLTHKWPMCNVKLTDIASSTTLNFVLDAFQLYNKDQRPLVRSVYIQGTPFPQQSHRIQYLDNTSSEPEPKHHLIIAQRSSGTQTINAELLPRGLACFTTVDKTDQVRLGDYFEPVCNIDLSQGEKWQLWRKKPSNSVIPPNMKRVLFGALPPGTSLDALGPFHKSVPLEPDTVAAFCHNLQNTRFHAVIMDPPNKSIIPYWFGQDLLPLLQALLKFADSVMWVTEKHTSSPFQKMAGTLLRTLQAEQPSLKICWFLWSEEFQKKHNGKHFEVEFLKVQQSMLDGQNELMQDFAGAGAPQIIRYYPDDELSCSTGTIPPRKVTGSLDHAECELTFAAPREPVILCEAMKSFDDSSMHQLIQGHLKPACQANGVEANTEDLVQVAIEAFVIDLNDIKTFDGCTDTVSTAMQPRFFAGIVKHDLKGCYEPNFPVVGWSNKGHRNRLHVRRSALFRRGSKQPAGEAASEFAATAVAVYIVHEVARARKGETFDLQVTGPLYAALTALCKQNGNTVTLRSSGQKANFVVCYDALKGLRVNNQAIDMNNCFSSASYELDEWDRIAPLPGSVVTHGISDYSKAFSKDSKARQESFSTVIDHTIHSARIEHVPIYKPQATLFSSTANYVLIGGLGGLGRFICTWMVEHGAKQLTVVSRSGLASAEAQSTHVAITETGATLDVFAADACDRPTVRGILSSIRRRGPIKGIINLAMILGDAPMASMTGEEWDRAMRVKIDSSWILHEETLDDDLDHFILFSSIASVCGNRNQGNYNVANTFLNALAEYRQGMGRCGVSIALGAMTDMGVLYNLSKPNMLDVLTRSGLSHLTQKELAKIMEAAILISPRRDHHLLLTGLQMFGRDADNKLVGRNHAPLFWTELPEFSHLQTYAPPNNGGNPSKQDKIVLKEHVANLLAEGGSGEGGESATKREDVKKVVADAFVGFLSQLSGFTAERIDTERGGVGMYGIDSLSGVGCQYWFHRELGIDISVINILGANTIAQIVDEACEKLLASGKR